MRGARWIVGMVMLGVVGCRPIGAEMTTPTPVAAATSYVAPLRTEVPTSQAMGVPTPVPEDITALPTIVDVGTTAGVPEQETDTP
jgi:hypothetical protein